MAVSGQGSGSKTYDITHVHVIHESHKEGPRVSGSLDTTRTEL